MRSYTHLPYTPSGRLDPSFDRWRSCPLGVSTWISRCWLLWSTLVLACIWRSSWRIHSVLGNKALKCRKHFSGWIRGKMTKQDPLIHPETGNEIQKCFYISVPYFPGLSESFKKIFKYTPVQVCFKGVNTLKSMLMHPKDKISNDQKKDLVYHWECKADGCNSSYIGETSRALGERVKEHSPSLQHLLYWNTARISITLFLPSRTST